MTKPMIDHEALISMFQSATARQGDALRKAVGEATLAALQGRELSLRNIRATLKSVTDAAGAGALKNPLGGTDTGQLLDSAVAGMDDALLKAVDAHRVALQQLATQGADLRETHLKKAVADLERMEDMLIDTVRKSAGSAGEQAAAAWAPVLERLNAGGTASGTQAASAAEQFAQQMQQMQTALRGSRAAGLRAAQTLAESYGALVSGVLIGMSDAMRKAAAAPGPGKGRKGGG